MRESKALGWMLVAVVVTAGVLGAAVVPTREAHAQTVDDELVYIDAGGFLRVKDFSSTGSGQAPVVWSSPIGGYINATLVDVQGDGDMEIAALRVTSDLNSMDIYDPVIAGGVFDPDQTTGGIPWTQLYARSLSHEPLLIAAGDLDVLSAGDEIFLTEEASPPSFLRQVGAHDGREWEKVEMTIPDRDWDRVAIGDMDISGLDELALVNSTDSSLTIWRMIDGGNTQKLYEVVSESRKWQWPAMGKWRGDGRELLGMVRLALNPWPTFIIYRFSFANQGIRDDHAEVFTPGPRFIMFGDVDGNGDDEAFMLRELPVEDTRARLIGRNRNSAPLALTEDPLNAVSGYLHGATGDIDGDGKDEVILVGRTQFRYYLSPDTSVTATDEVVLTNGRTLLAGDLDKAGYVQALLLQVSTTVASSATPAGGQAPPVTIQVTNGTNDSPLAFNTTVAGQAPWMNLAVSGSKTPATLTATFNSTRLVEGTYVANVELTSPNPLVLNQPVQVQIRLTINAGLLLQPDGLAFVRADCQQPDSVESQNVKIIAPSGSPYTVSLVPSEQAVSVSGSDGVRQGEAPAITWPSSVAWATATSATGIAPETMKVTVDYADRTADLQNATAIVTANVNGTTLVRTLALTLFCAEHRAMLPIASQ